jgi:predicted  nucleic acid-binding Zn-ribbon protein
MSGWTDVVRLHDLDLLLEEARAGGARQRSLAVGFRLEGLPALERARAHLCARLEPRWVHAYERARRRYGRAVVAVHGRVCQGCFITLPTAAANAETLSVCESCGRILFRR